MPQVDPVADFAGCMAKARELSSGVIDVPGQEKGQCRVALIMPGRLIMAIPCPPAGAVTNEMLMGVRQIVPSDPKLAITVIGFNDITKQNALTPEQINGLIPFLGYLVGLAYDGHNVVVFEGHPSALQAGCKNADLLIVDQRMILFLQNDCGRSASSVMKTQRILVFGSDGPLAEIDPASPPSIQAEPQELSPYMSTIIVAHDLAPPHDRPQPVASMGLLRAAATSLLLSSGFVAICGLIYLPGMLQRLLEFLTSAKRDPEGAMFIPMFLASYPIFIGAWNMRRGMRYRLAYAAAVLACIPTLTPGFCFGLPLGIWALTVLHRHDVKQAFADQTRTAGQK
jgi:hypothetical protein